MQSSQSHRLCRPMAIESFRQIRIYFASCRFMKSELCKTIGQFVGKTASYSWHALAKFIPNSVSRCVLNWMVDCVCSQVIASCRIAPAEPSPLHTASHANALAHRSPTKDKSLLLLILGVVSREAFPALEVPPPSSTTLWELSCSAPVAALPPLRKTAPKAYSNSLSPGTFLMNAPRGHF